MNKNTIKALLSIEVDKNLAEKISSDGLTIGGLQNQSDTELREIGLTDNTIKYLRSRKRPAIPEATLNSVLLKSRFCCSICHDPSKGVIVHHINEWNESRSHDEDNLIVLCSNHHDLAHTKKELTRELSPKVLKAAKVQWEEVVRIAKEKAANGSTSTSAKENRLIEIEDNIYRNIDNNKLYNNITAREFFKQRQGFCTYGKVGFICSEDSSQGVNDLLSLLKYPTVFDSGRFDYSNQPICYWRGRVWGDIKSVRMIDSTTILINNMECSIKRVCHYKDSNDRYRYSYIEINPLPAIVDTSFDVTSYPKEDNDNLIFDRYWVDGDNIYSDNEYEDGFALKGGERVKISSTADLRERFIVPYNLIVSYKDSPYNVRTDQYAFFQKIMNDILMKKISDDEFKKLIRSL